LLPPNPLSPPRARFENGSVSSLEQEPIVTAARNAEAILPLAESARDRMVAHRSTIPIDPLSLAMRDRLVEELARHHTSSDVRSPPRPRWNIRRWLLRRARANVPRRSK
jgi:hypothetical protein